VDGIAQDLKGQARVLRIDVGDEIGEQAARRYGVRGLPTFIVFDGQGQVVHVEAGVPDRARLVEQARSELNK
jgi:thioredoxin-related protein